jgi:hypothetical protein
MIRNYSIAIFIMLTPLFIGPNAAHAEYVLNFQVASVSTAKNDVQIPGDTGTRFSLSDDLHAERAFSWRIEAGYIFGGRDYVGFMVLEAEKPFQYIRIRFYEMRFRNR